MSEKRYCFIPEHNKDIAVYEAGTIPYFQSGEEIKNMTPSIKFKHCIDVHDKIKTFYIDTQNQDGSTDDENYFKYKTITAIKSFFGVSEIHDYKLIIDEESRIEFTLFYDKDGTWIPISNLYEKNRNNTILAHTYVYGFYKRYAK